MQNTHFFDNSPIIVLFDMKVIQEIAKQILKTIEPFEDIISNGRLE
jgi:hypothetical protein